MAQNTNNDFVFHVDNVHNDEAGRPPAITHKPGLMHLYFEQWLVIFDKKTGRCTLRSGDAGWDVSFDVFDGGVMGMIVGKHAARLVAAFWEMATDQLATAPHLLLADIGESETFDPTSQSPSRSLDEAIESATRGGRKAILIDSPYSLGSNHSDCMTSLRKISDAGLVLRIMNLGPLTAAIKAKLADWDGSSSDDPDDDRPRFRVPKPSRN